MSNDDFEAVTTALQSYFSGLHEANIEKLTQVCAEELVLHAPNIRRTRNEWFELIKSRPTPQTEGHEFNYKILSLDLVGSQAMAKLACPLLGHNYVDFIGLLKEQGQWKIVSKMYCDINSK